MAQAGIVVQPARFATIGHSIKPCVVARVKIEGLHIDSKPLILATVTLYQADGSGWVNSTGEEGDGLCSPLSYYINHHGFDSRRRRC